MLYNQTIAAVIASDTPLKTGPIIVKVKKPVIIIERSGVNVKSTADGNHLWNLFSKKAKSQTATKTGITWYW